jgi:pimeloyl-ACP methyl ester carboxylesterase
MDPTPLPRSADERWIETSVGRLRVLHAGTPSPDRMPAMLIHGGGVDNSTISWCRLFEPLGTDREVWAIDLPGFGGSIDVAPVGGPVAMAHLVAEVMGKLDASPAAVIGVSMGGDVALNLALDHPEDVAALVLISPGGLVPVLRNHIVQFAAWAVAQLPDPLLFPLARFANRFVDQALAAIVNEPSSLPPQVVAEFVHEARHPRGGMGYGRYNQATLGRSGMRNDLTSRVQDIAAPTLFFHGEDDGMVDPAGSQRAVERMPQARLVLVPDCGYWGQLEQHDLFLQETQAFLGQIDG